MHGRIAERVAPFRTTIFTEINEWAAAHQAINLGQGAPDFPSPPEVIAAATRALTLPTRQQYAPGWGYLETRGAVADHAARFYGQKVDPASEVLICNGCTEAYYAAIMGLVNPDDEVILFEPFYDSYAPVVAMAGAIARYIPLNAPNWDFDREELAGLFNAKTRAIVVNTPHNPTGKVFSRDELTYIAELCQKYDVIAITDEVYEHILFDDSEHIRLATLPNMAERTVTLSSLGKTFTVTGWKIGWAIAPADLITAIFRARQFVSFSVASPLQWAAAEILGAPNSYFEELRALYQAKRDLLYNALLDTPLKPIKPQGAYFVMADVSALNQADDRAAALHLIQNIGVAGIPPSAFYSAAHQHLARNLIRLSACKTDETLNAAIERLQKLA